MIGVLDHRDSAVASKIRAVFQLAYTKEAELIGADDFPPLRRNVSDIVSAASTFHGVWQDEGLAAILEYRAAEESLEIDSLVVHPNFFRRGLAKLMMIDLLQRRDWQIATVETAGANMPAILLYEKLGFSESKRWMLEVGIEKVRLIRRKNSHQTGE